MPHLARLATKSQQNLCRVIPSRFDSDSTSTVRHRLEVWRLRNAWLKSLTPSSDLEYGNTELSTYDLEIRYDWAELEGRDATGERIFAPK